MVPQPNFNKIRIVFFLQRSDTDKDLGSSVELTYLGHPVKRDARRTKEPGEVSQLDFTQKS